LNPALEEHGGNFPKHKLKFSGAQCHAAAVSLEAVEERRADGVASREYGPGL
jgi:hypothetical protein